MTADKDNGFRAIQARLRMAILLSDLPEAYKVVGLFMVEHLSREEWQSEGHLVTWIGVPTTAEVLGMDPRTVKRARATMRDAGILLDGYEGGHGPGDTAHLLFSTTWLEEMEAMLHRGGQFAKIGRGKRRKSDRAATLPGLFDDVTLAATKSDSAATHSGGNQPLTLAMGDNGAPHTPAQPVDMSAQAADPVENSAPGTASNGLRVTAEADKGGSGGTERVTPLPPEHVFKHGSNPARVRTRGRRAGSPPGPTNGQMSIMLPIDGGQQGHRQVERSNQGAPLTKVIATSRAAATAADNDRLEELLQRAGALLGNRADGNLAVSALQSHRPDLYRGLVRGQEVDDASLRDSLAAALTTVDRGEAASATRVAATSSHRTPAPSGAPIAPLDEATVAATVAQVLTAMTPALLAQLAPAVVTATLQALRGQQGVAA